MRKATLHLKQADPVLRGIIGRVGPCRFHYQKADFLCVARAIAYQQLNGKAAATIFARLEAAAGGTLTPESVLALSDAELRGAGLSKQKSSYMRDLAQRTLSGELDFGGMPRMKDEDVIAHLTQVKGIGVWSAQMFLLSALRRMDVLPTGDFGIRTAIQRAYRKRRLPTPREIEKIARPWHPYCSVASWYLWRSLDIKTLQD